MEVSRVHSMAPWALASVGASCAVQSARGLAISGEMPILLVPLGVGGLAISAFIFGRMLFKRVSGDETWGAPAYTAGQSHLVFWSSTFVAVFGVYLWARGS